MHAYSARWFVARKYDSSDRCGKRGPVPTKANSIRKLVLQMAAENSSWGYGYILDAFNLRVHSPEVHAWAARRSWIRSLIPLDALDLLRAPRPGQTREAPCWRLVKSPRIGLLPAGAATTPAVSGRQEVWSGQTVLVAVGLQKDHDADEPSGATSTPRSN